MTDLIVVEKAGERISVHPATLGEHQRAGWSISADQANTSALAIDVAFGGALRTDGPTVAEYVERGYLAVNYPPEGYASRSTAEEIAAAIAAQQAPAGGGNEGSDGPVSETPDGIPTPIPEDWETMHHTKQISLAKALAGDFTAPEGQTMTEKAKSIILAAVTDRANPPAK